MQLRKTTSVEAVQYTGENDKEIIDFFIKHNISKRINNGVLTAVCSINFEIAETDWVVFEPGRGLYFAADDFIKENYKELE